ncbi:MAG: ABC transporter permease [Clostridiales bacterium]|nr:ABC transporter permease [Clostridiales bacterium]
MQRLAQESEVQKIGSTVLTHPQRRFNVSVGFWRVFRRNRFAVASAGVLVMIIIAAVFAPILATHDPSRITLSSEFIKQSPSVSHYFGTDHLGRDLWSRMVYGARVSLTVGFLTMFITVFIGTVYGAVSGYYGGRLDSLLMMLVDIFLSIPTLFLLIVLAVFIKPGYLGIAVIIGLTSWMRVARLVRGEFLRLKEREHVLASRALGFSDSRLIFGHILPNTSALIVVNATLTVASAILAESVLGFLGLGIQPPQFSWGSLLSNAQDLILVKEAPWIVFFPGMAIFVTVLSLNFVGEGLRDALDSRCQNIK